MQTGPFKPPQLPSLRAAALPLPLPHAPARNWSREHSSPPSSELSPSKKHDLAASLPRCTFPLCACSCHDTVQLRIEVVHLQRHRISNALLQGFEFGSVKYAGALASLSAALCFQFGGRPRRALCFWQAPLPLCRARSV